MTVQALSTGCKVLVPRVSTTDVMVTGRTRALHSARMVTRTDVTRVYIPTIYGACYGDDDRRCYIRPRNQLKMDVVGCSGGRDGVSTLHQNFQLAKKETLANHHHHLKCPSRGGGVHGSAADQCASLAF